MDCLAITMAYCYGIKSFAHTFDFTGKPVYAIYAPNGMMKTSFAKAMMDYSRGKPSKDEIYPERQTVRTILDANGNEISPDAVFVIEPYNSTYKSSKVATLLVNNELRTEYEEILESIERSLDNLLQPIRKLSGIRKDIAAIIAQDITSTPKDVYAALRRIGRKPDCRI